mgnify:CR=1 FL=1
MSNGTRRGVRAGMPALLLRGMLSLALAQTPQASPKGLETLHSALCRREAPAFQRAAQASTASGDTLLVACTQEQRLFLELNEQTEGAAQVDHRTDIWAMGVILYEGLTGQQPFQASNYNALLVQIINAPHRPCQQMQLGLALFGRVGQLFSQAHF